MKQKRNIVVDILLIMLLVALFVYDIFMTVMIRAYFANIRKRIQSLLK